MKMASYAASPCIAVLLMALGSALALDNYPSCDLDLIRLPETFVPSHYDVSIEPDLNTFTFKGHVDIYASYNAPNKAKKCSKVQRVGKLLGKAAKKVFVCGASDGADGELCDRRIILNVGKSIQPTRVEVLSENFHEKVNLATDNICLDRANQLLSIGLSRKAAAGETFWIRIAYTGVIGEESRGFFKSEHIDPSTSSKYTNANTHFFPADARSAYPSFDEPHFKATFKLTLIHDPSLQSVSNANRDYSTRRASDNFQISRFKQTQKMSTYNFAFAVGHYDLVKCSSRQNVHAFVPIGRAEDSQFIVDTVCKAIGVGEAYFAREFPLEKLDIVVTKQMRDPSRENWGMLVITEDFLFVNADTTNVLRAEITKLAVHIVLHQWWGDLITAKWWDDQWIFDGFTIWQSHWSTAAIYPELDYDFNYLLRLQSPMLDAHTNSSVHAIKTYQVLDADQELALFDANTYNKAGAVYQMLDATFRPSFQAGLIRLLNSRAYSAADANDFFSIVGSVVHYDLEPLLRSWLDQPGVPVVRASLGSNVVELAQSRLVDKPTVGTEQQRWVIPVTYQFLRDKQVISAGKIFMNEKERILPLPSWFDATDPGHSVKLNTNFDGFYRVQYDEQLLRRLRDSIESRALPPADRFNIIDDLRGLLKLGQANVALVEEALSWYTRETSGGVISGLALVVPVLSAAHKAAGKDASDTQKIVFSLFEHVFEESGFSVIEGQRHAQMNGRQDALLALVTYKHQPTIEAALKVFDSSDVHLTPFLRKPTYLAVINHGSDEQFGQLIERLRDTKSLYERQVLVASLAPYATNKERITLVGGTLIQ